MLISVLSDKAVLAESHSDEIVQAERSTEGEKIVLWGYSALPIIWLMMPKGK